MGTIAPQPLLSAAHAPDAWRPNLSWITDRLAVGGSFPCERAETLAQALGIRAVVDLRAESCDDAGLLAGAGIDFLHLPAPDHHPPSLPMIEAGVAFARAHLRAGAKVLVHCEHGIGRSALLALCVLVEEGAEPLAALRLAKSRRSLVSPSPAQYEAWAEWLRGRGRSVPDFESFASVAYAHLAPA